jgi:hypothetical protein
LIRVHLETVGKNTDNPIDVNNHPQEEGGFLFSNMRLLLHDMLGNNYLKLRSGYKGLLDFPGTFFSQ